MAPIFSHNASLEVPPLASLSLRTLLIALDGAALLVTDAVAKMVDWKDVVGNVLLFFLVFGMSATVEARSLVRQLKNRRAIATGIFLQFVILPLLGFAMVYTLNLPNAVGITLLVVTSSPGGSYSNWCVGYLVVACRRHS